MMRLRVVLLGSLAMALVPQRSSAGLDLGDNLGRAADAITAMDLDKAKGLLAPLDAAKSSVALQHGRLALYLGDCDEAAKRLGPPNVQKDEKDAGALLNVARDCMRAMAATITVKDTVHDVEVRFQDEADAPLASLLGETVAKQREVLARDLGVEMPKPTRVDVVRDQLSLSALTGLPWEAARKTGTVAIAKFGRVIMVSPRAPSLGYAWRDTLAHELTHLALSRGTLDRAPLWLQEGVAKREETRWRVALPTDDVLSPDAIAAVGFERKAPDGTPLALELHKLGPSIALLPSATQAMVAYAEVTSFVRFIAGDRAGEPNAPTDHDVLLKLVKAYARGLDTDGALKDVTGKDLATWNGIWQPWVKSKKAKLPEQLGLDEPKSKEALKAEMKLERETTRAFRLGQLLLSRDHVKAARTRLDPLAGGHVGDPMITAWIARARLLDGDPTGAKAVLDPRTLVGDLGQWWAVRGDVLRTLWTQTGSASGVKPQEISDAHAIAVAHDPLTVETVCTWADVPAGAAPFEGWLDAAVKGLCEAARARHLPRMGQD